MSKSEEKVRELAKLSILSNRISEIHEKNLKSYPFIFFNGVKEATVNYDLERGKKNHVSFILTVKEGENLFLEKRLTSLDQSVKNLFWKEVSTSVILNGKKVFDSTIDTIANKFMENNKGLFEDLAKAEEAEKKVKNA